LLLKDHNLLIGLHGLILGIWKLRVGEDYSEPTSGISRLIENLGDFSELRLLSIRGIKLGAVPKSIWTLQHLETLELLSISCNVLPEWIAELSQLKVLSIMDNKLNSLPFCYRKLQKLKHISLSFNPLKQIPRCIFELEFIEELYLADCQIHEIPTEILRLPNLRVFNYSMNLIASPPEEVAAKGLDAVRDYWRQRRETGVDYLCEAKLIILGEAGAGKTSLAHKIENPAYELKTSEKSTEGIDVVHYSSFYINQLLQQNHTND